MTELTFREADLYWLIAFFALATPSMIYCACRLGTKTAKFLARRIEGREPRALKLPGLNEFDTFEERRWTQADLLNMNEGELYMLTMAWKTNAWTICLGFPIKEKRLQYIDPISNDHVLRFQRK